MNCIHALNIQHHLWFISQCQRVAEDEGGPDKGARRAAAGDCQAARTAGWIGEQAAGLWEQPRGCQCKDPRGKNKMNWNMALF